LVGGKSKAGKDGNVGKAGWKSKAERRREGGKGRQEKLSGKELAGKGRW
jgi:hypothetical protein